MRYISILSYPLSQADCSTILLGQLAEIEAPLVEVSRSLAMMGE